MTIFDTGRSILCAGIVLVALSSGSVPVFAQPIPVGDEFVVNTYTTNNQMFPQVARDAAGNFVVVWGSDGQDGDGFGVFGQRFDSDSNPVGPEFQVNTYTTGDQGSFLAHPGVAMNPAGDFVVVWGSTAGQDGSSYGVFGQRFNADGTPAGGEFQVNTGTLGAQFFPAVGMEDDGDFVVVWPGYNGPLDDSYAGVVGQRFDSTGAMVGGEFQVNTYTTSIQIMPSISVGPTGEFVVVWASYLQDGSLTGVFGQRFDADAVPAGGEFQVNTYTTGWQGSYLIFALTGPEVAMNDSGDFVVIWDSSNQPPDGDGLGVFGQRYDAAGNPMGGEFPINTTTPGNQLFADLAVEDDGDFVVVWFGTDQDGSSYGAVGQAFDFAGNPLGGEFAINTYTTGSQAAVDASCRSCLRRWSIQRSNSGASGT